MLRSLLFVLLHCANYASALPLRGLSDFEPTYSTYSNALGRLDGDGTPVLHLSSLLSTLHCSENKQPPATVRAARARSA